MVGDIIPECPGDIMSESVGDFVGIRTLADDLSGQVFDLIDALQEVQDTLDKLVGLQPEDPDD